MPDSNTRAVSHLGSNPIVREILKAYKPVWALNHSMAVLNWDMETRMPKDGAGARGIASGQVAVMIQKATIELDRLVRNAEKAKAELDEVEKGVIRVLRRDLDFYLKLPPKLVDEIQRVTIGATVGWRAARKNSDFRSFKPFLGRIIQLQRDVADRLGYEGHPYNALLNLYEEGFTIEDADTVFSRLIPASKKILAKVSSAGVYPNAHPLESQEYDKSAMEKVNEGILKILKMPKDSFRVDISTHPFTTAIAPRDVRITTRYEGTNFKSALFSTIHESGHALYGLGIASTLAYTPLGAGASYGIHESQSRFWENVVGRGREFGKLIGPVLRKNLPFLGGFDDEQLYYYFNTVRKSYIRVDADELTYNFHIALRYEVEKRMIGGKVEVAELPELWNDTFEKYFGMRPRNDAEGILQDIHWSQGSMGYFPTYSLGNVVLGMIWHQMKDGGLVRDAVDRGNLTDLKTWLGTRIHKHGATYSPKDLQKKVFGETYNPERLVGYLERKFAA
jgi:carboxypeptidase Taq